MYKYRPKQPKRPKGPKECNQSLNPKTRGQGDPKGLHNPNGMAPMDPDSFTNHIHASDNNSLYYLPLFHWRPLSIAYFYSLLLLLFLFIGFCVKLVLVSRHGDPVLFVLDVHMKYTVEVVPLCIHIVCGVLQYDTFTLLVLIWNTPGLWAVFAT